MQKRSIVQVVGVVGFAATLLVLPGCHRAGPPTGPVLVYEVDPQAVKDSASINMEQVAQAVDKRLNPGYAKLAVVRVQGDRRLEIALYDNDPEAVGRVRDLMARTGTLEFRILANKRNHASLVKRGAGG